MKIAVFTKYSQKGASSRLRFYQYFPELAEIEFSNHALLDDDYLNALYSGKKINKVKVLVSYLSRLFKLLGAKRYDVLWVQGEFFPYFPAWAERLLDFFGVAYVVDYDDAIFHNYDLSENPLIRSLLANKIDSVMMHSACVVVGNSYLKERAQLAGARRIELIPTVIDINRYPKIESSAAESQEVVVGWIGSPSTQKYIVDLKSVLFELSQKFPLKLRLVGANKTILTELEDLNVEVLSWSEDTEVNQIQTFDVGVMPLIDGPWEKGKCGYKLIQYMACGKAVIASPVGVNVQIIEAALCGFLAKNQDEWEKSLNSLLGSYSLRDGLGKKGRAAVESRYTLQLQKLNLEAIFNSIISG